MKSSPLQFVPKGTGNLILSTRRDTWSLLLFSLFLKEPVIWYYLQGETHETFVFYPDSSSLKIRPGLICSLHVSFPWSSVKWLTGDTILIYKNGKEFPMAPPPKNSIITWRKKILKPLTIIVNPSPNPWSN